jgi:hypothetical protein
MAKIFKLAIKNIYPNYQHIPISIQVLIPDLIFPVYKIDREQSVGSSSHRGPVILEREKSGSDPGQFHYAMITDAQ